MNTSKLIITALAMWTLTLPGMQAQEVTERQEAVKRQEADKSSSTTGWYAGVEGGVPFGFSTFSSCGADKVRAGYAFGLYGGYRFNSVLSAELTLKWGKATLLARDCCVQSSYWLDADGSTLFAPVIDGQNWSYADLESRVTLQEYSVRLNVNLLGLFEATQQSRWTLEVSPRLSAVGTKATVGSRTDDIDVLKGDTRWHLGAGGNVQAGYRLTEHLGVGIYSGILWLSGNPMDGMPELGHKANHLWESGVRVSWAFGKSRKTTAAPVPAVQEDVPEPVREVCPETSETPAAVAPDTAMTSQADRVPDHVADHVPADRMVDDKVAVETEAEVRLTFPAVYFDFNRTDIRPGETEKLQAIRELLCEHPDVQILVTGWCDTVGSRAVNDRISRQRAEAVKAWLVGHGIEADRIRVVGMGSDTTEPDAAKARRVTTEEERKEARP